MLGMRMDKMRIRPDLCVEFYRISRRGIVCGFEVDNNGTIINWAPYIWRLGGKQIGPVLTGLKQDGWKVEKLEVK
jgi:hypothetical protein